MQRGNDLPDDFPSIEPERRPAILVKRRMVLGGAATSLIATMLFKAVPARASAPSARLQLGRTLWLVITEEGVSVQDIGKSYLADGSLAFANLQNQPVEAMRADYAFSLTVISATRSQNENASHVRCLHVELLSVRPDRGDRTALLRARFADGAIEIWRIISEPALQRWSWHRSTIGRAHNGGTALFEVRTPRSEAMLQFWQTGSGEQIINAGVPGKIQGQRAKLVESNQSEALFYSLLGPNTFRVSCPGASKLEIDQSTNIRDPFPYEPYWENDSNGKIRDNLWIARWSAPVGSAQLSASIGVTAASRDFVGVQKIDAVDASADFGPFFSQVYLGALPLTLRRYPDGLVAPRCNVLIAEVEAYKAPWSRDIMWNAEFLYVVAPESVAKLLKGYLDWRLTNSRSFSNGGDDAEIELVLMAGRHLSITGDAAFAAQHLPRYRTIMDNLWQKRPSGSDLPIFNASWDGQGLVVGQEPYVTAEYFAALERLAAMEDLFGNFTAGSRYRAWASALKAQALRPYQEGGFWHAGRGTFINYIDHAPSIRHSPRQHTWSQTPDNPGVNPPVGSIRHEFALYETIVPIWLGLLNDPDKIRQAYAWIDGHYSYASGRGGFDLPPHTGQSFVLLLDACVRKRHGIDGADRIFQRANDHGLDGGIPFTEMPLGTMAGAGPQLPDGQFKFYAATHAGRTWDNAPYFGLSVSFHYGLDYDHRGWSIRSPDPLSDYPVTKLTNLRHRDAIFNLRWTGRGQVQEILVNGVRLSKPLLTAVAGIHDVEVRLA